MLSAKLPFAVKNSFSSPTQLAFRTCLSIFRQRSQLKIEFFLFLADKKLHKRKKRPKMDFTR
jgi:hypothetical protein